MRAAGRRRPRDAVHRAGRGVAGSGRRGRLRLFLRSHGALRAAGRRGLRDTAPRGSAGRGAGREGHRGPGAELLGRLHRPRRLPFRLRLPAPAPTCGGARPRDRRRSLGRRRRRRLRARPEPRRGPARARTAGLLRHAVSPRPPLRAPAARVLEVAGTRTRDRAPSAQAPGHARWRRCGQLHGPDRAGASSGARSSRARDACRRRSREPASRRRRGGAEGRAVGLASPSAAGRHVGSLRLGGPGGLGGRVDAGSSPSWACRS